MPGLPIDLSDVLEIEKEIIEEEESLLKKYQYKNISQDFIKSQNINKKENQIINIDKDGIEKKLEEDMSEYNIDLDFVRRMEGYKEKWKVVEVYMSENIEGLWRIGIIEADDLLNTLLEERGYTGETIFERLKNARFNTIDLAFDVHKIRNRIAHNGSKFVLTEKLAKNTFNSYKQIFNEFKLFD